MIILNINCENKKQDDQICYRCIYQKQTLPDCDSLAIYEACVIAPYEQSLQDVLQISKFCNGIEISTKEDLGFIEDFIAEQEYAGAICDEF